jgi:hypothetical protein
MRILAAKNRGEPGDSGPANWPERHVPVDGPSADCNALLLHAASTATAAQTLHAFQSKLAMFIVIVPRLPGVFKHPRLWRCAESTATRQQHKPKIANHSEIWKDRNSADCITFNCGDGARSFGYPLMQLSTFSLFRKRACRDPTKPRLPEFSPPHRTGRPEAKPLSAVRFAVERQRGKQPRA